MENLFKGIFDTSAVNTISFGNFMLVILIALAIGGIFTVAYAISASTTKSFLVCLGILPAVVSMVIMMVNGNIGAGVAVAGAFSLVRFRSATGSARDITMIFISMASGLVCGMGYLAYAVLFSVIMSIIVIITGKLISEHSYSSSREKLLRITVPECLEYSGEFDEILKKYTTSYRLVKVKTSNMGTLFKLSYNITEARDADEKKFIDELRVRNGNLEVMITEREGRSDEL